MKKVIALIISIAMIASLATGLAVTSFATDNEAKIGSTEYATLKDAIDAAVDSDLITLLKDISYSDGPNFVIDAKNVTIDFAGHSITVNTGFVQPTNTKLFTVENSGKLSVKNGEIIFSGMMYGGRLEAFTVSGTNSTLNVIGMTQENNLDRFITSNGGNVTISGGTFGTNNIATKINLTNNATLTLTDNPTFNCQGNLINVSDTANTDPDTLTANVTVESGTFRGDNTIGIIALYAKANVTINGGTFTSSSANSAPIFIGNYGYKSSVTINNLTSDSPYVFRSNINSNIENFESVVNDGHFKYKKGQFAVDSDNGLKPKVNLKGGYFGPNEPDDDAFNELNAFCASGYHAEVLADIDPEYIKGYKYKIVLDTPADPEDIDEEDTSDPEVDITIGRDTVTLKTSNKSVVINDENYVKKEVMESNNLFVPFDLSTAPSKIEGVFLNNDIYKYINGVGKGLEVETRYGKAQAFPNNLVGANPVSLHLENVKDISGKCATAIQKAAMQTDKIYAEINYSFVSNGKPTENDAKIYVPVTGPAKVFYLFNAEKIGIVPCEVIDGYCIFDRYYDGTYIICAE